MNIVDIIALVIIGLGALMGFKRGAIKSIVQLIGFLAIIIVSYQFKGVVGNFLIKFMPFFNFGGNLDGIYAINILVYQGIAFIIVFVLLYCVLNILINISGILDLVVKFTIIFELPSKIIGAILGAIEGIFLVFICSFALMQFGHSQTLIMESKYALKIVERTPVVNRVFGLSIAAAENVYISIQNATQNENKTDANLEIIRTLIRYSVVDAEVVQEQINNGKLHLDNVVVAS